MIDTLTVISYLLGNHFGHNRQIKLSAHFLEDPHHPACVSSVQSPSLRWRDIPPEASSVAIIVKDAIPPKSGEKTHYYWVIYNLPVETVALPFGASSYMLHDHVGLNSWGEQNYHSRCWGDQVHPVSIEVIALNDRIESDKPLSGEVLEKEIRSRQEVVKQGIYRL